MIEARGVGEQLQRPRQAAAPPGFDPALPQRLAARLAQPRRTEAARELESELSYGRHAGPAPPSARAAAVLVLLYPAGGDWCLPLTVRRSELGTHGGQISLPGGLVDPGETSQAAALRELREELGVGPDELTVLGRLADLYVFVSDRVVTPWVATAAARPRFRPNPAEVAEVLELPLKRLLDPASLGVAQRVSSGVTFRSPYFALGEHQVWGATSMILSELRSVLRDTHGEPAAETSRRGESDG